MPFKSEAQRRKFYAMEDRGEISKKTVDEWEAATPKGKKLPERAKKKSSKRAADIVKRAARKVKKRKGKKRKKGSCSSVSGVLIHGGRPKCNEPFATSAHSSMSKTAKLSDLTLGDIGKRYARYTGRTPLTKMLTHGALLGGAGALLAPSILKHTAPGLYARVNVPRLRGVAGALGVLAGTVPWIPWGYANVKAKGVPGMWSTHPYKYPTMWESLFSKTGSWGLGKSMDTFSLKEYPTIPMTHSLQTITNDPYMDNVLKAEAFDTMMQASGGKKHGLISIGDVIRTTVGAGLGYRAGNLMGSLFGLPAQTQRRLSQAGLLAGALEGALHPRGGLIRWSWK